jgi:hypothetical protein
LALIVVIVFGHVRLANGESIIVWPTDSGTVRFLPELGILEAGVVGNDIQSTYGRTRDLNREFRRGFFEFAVPEFSTGIVNATLTMNENRVQASDPFPPDLHELSYYPADLVVNGDDYERPTTFIASFETDINVSPQRLSFDVTSLISRFEGRNLGFRIKLDADPSWTDFTNLGSAFAWPRMEVNVVPDPSSVPPAVTAYTSLDVFINALGSATDVDFENLPAGDILRPL